MPIPLAPPPRPAAAEEAKAAAEEAKSAAEETKAPKAITSIAEAMQQAEKLQRNGSAYTKTLCKHSTAHHPHAKLNRSNHPGTTDEEEPVVASLRESRRMDTTDFSPARRALHDFVMSDSFINFIYLCIGLNTVVLALERVDQPPSEKVFCKTTNLVLTYVFILELTLQVLLHHIRLRPHTRTDVHTHGCTTPHLCG